MFKQSSILSLFIFIIMTASVFAQERQQKFPDLYVIQVSASWCQPCQNLKNRVLSTRPVKALLKEYKSSNGQEDWEVKPYYINFDDKTKADALGVTRIPTLIIMDDEGNIYNEYVGSDYYNVVNLLKNPYRNKNKTPIRKYIKKEVETPAVFEND